MTIITKITTQQKNKSRYNIFMDSGKGEEYAFSIDENVLIKYSLKKGMDIDEFFLMEIQNSDDVRKTYNRAIHYIARRMRSEKEVREYLVQKEMSLPAIDEVIHKLTEQKYLDDEQFAIAFVRTQANTTDKGINTVQSELKEKGVSETVIRISLTEYTKDQQIEKAVKLCVKGIKKYRNESAKILKLNLEQMLLRKGYPFEIISIAIAEADIKGEEDQQIEAVKYQGEKAHRKYAKLSGYEYKQKMKQTLFRKGFSIEIIDRFLEDGEDSI